jgi:tRNA nucleotidyltransferase (CCA-adding enzyme)
MNMLQQLTPILESILREGGRPLIVGGAVRDELLGASPKDIDVEVYGLGAQQLAGTLVRHGKVAIVGQSFGVLKLRLEEGTEFDFSLPRRDNKTGVGHKGFRVELNAQMSHTEAAGRRDFTINAIGRQHDGRLVDPYGGTRDLANGVLRHVSAAFSEDPLRVLRGFQFVSRFRLKAAPETIALCASLLREAATLPSERIWEEWSKWAVKGKQPSLGLQFLRETGWLALWPQLTALIGVPHDPDHHPEGDVWTHTLHVVDAAAQIADREGVVGEERIVLLMAALCHDLGKPTTTEIVADGAIASHGHAEAGLEPTRRFLAAIGAWPRIIEAVLPLVAEHMFHLTSSVNPRTVRRLAHRLGDVSIEKLLLLMEADFSGRPPRPPGLPSNAAAIGFVAEQMTMTKARPIPIVLGRHLLQMGLVPGPQFTPLLARLFEAQLDGQFTDLDGGLAILRELLQQSEETRQ